MTTTFTIEQAKGMVGMVLLRLQARIKHLYPREQKKGPKGPWFQQKGYIVDETGEMVIVFNEVPDQGFRVGTNVIFKATTGPKGTHGVQVKSWQGNKGTNIELVITKSAIIVGSQEEEGSVSQVEPSTRMPQNEPQMPLEAISSPNVHEARKLGIATAKNKLTQYAFLYDLCWKTVEGMEMYSNIDRNNDLKKDVATTFFIQSVRDGLDQKMPIRTIEKFYGEKPEGVQATPEHEAQEHEESEVPF